MTVNASQSLMRDHLRVCGAVLADFLKPELDEGSSPRVRSGLISPSGNKRVAGIISACAERSVCESCRLLAFRDHLRVCGAVAAALVAI